MTRSTCICPQCAGTFSLHAVLEADGRCPGCGMATHRPPYRLLTIHELHQAHDAVFDNVNLGGFVRAYRSLIAQER